MSNNKNEDKDFDVLNEKVAPTFSGNENDNSNSEIDKTESANLESEVTTNEDELTSGNNEDNNLQSTGEEAPSIEHDLEEQQSQQNQIEKRKSPKWRWNFLNTVLALSSLGAVSFLILVGNPLANKSDTQVTNNNIKDITKSLTTIHGEVTKLKNQLNSKADNETRLKERQKDNERITGIEQQLTSVSLQIREIKKQSEMPRQPSQGGSSSINIDTIKNELKNVTDKQNEIAKKVNSVASQYNKLIDEQKQKSTSVKSDILLAPNELTKLLNGNSLLGINLTNGNAQAIFNNSIRGAFIAETGEQVGELTIINVTPERVDLKSKTHKIGSLTTK